MPAVGIDQLQASNTPAGFYFVVALFGRSRDRRFLGLWSKAEYWLLVLIANREGCDNNVPLQPELSHYFHDLVGQVPYAHRATAFPDG